MLELFPRSPDRARTPDSDAGRTGIAGRRTWPAVDAMSRENICVGCDKPVPKFFTIGERTFTATGERMFIGVCEGCWQRIGEPTFKRRVTMNIRANGMERYRAEPE